VGKERGCGATKGKGVLGRVEEEGRSSRAEAATKAPRAL